MKDNTFLLNAEYDFLRTNPRLGKNIILLVYGGSHAYGLNTKTSDIDIRGIALQQPSDLIGMSKFEQYVDETTDTTIYGFNKFMQLAKDGNPNILEILGVREEEVIYANDIGKKLLQNKEIFFSQNSAQKISSFAIAQLRKIQAVMAKGGDEKTQEEYILDASRKAAAHFNERYSTLVDNSNLTMFLDYDKKGTPQIMLNGSFVGVPIQELSGAYTDLKNIRQSFKQLTTMNKKKDIAHLNKHAYHLLRLLHMGTELLKNGELNVYRTTDHNILMDLKIGKFIDNGVLSPTFFELLEKAQKEYELASQHTTLPKSPDTASIEQLTMEINSKVVKEYLK